MDINNDCMQIFSDEHVVGLLFVFLQVTTKYLNVSEPISGMQSLTVAIVILGSKKKYTSENMAYGFWIFVVFFRYLSRCLKTENWKKYTVDTLLVTGLF